MLLFSPSAPDSPTSTKPAETPTEPSTPTGETVASPGKHC